MCAFKNEHTFTSSIRVMLVDDHLTMLWGLQQLIDSQKPIMEVVGIVSRKEEIVESTLRIQPDLIVLDVDLGNETSISVLPQLFSACKTKVLIFTGMHDEKLLDTAILCGARGLVRKEESTEVVLRAIKRIHAGELWLDRETTGRLFSEMHAPQKAKPTKDSEKICRLTPKERQVIDLILQQSGLQNKKLAQCLCMSEHTLRNHLTSIYQKLGVDNRLGLYVYASKLNLSRKEP